MNTATITVNNHITSLC